VGLTWQFDPTCTALCQKPSNAGTEMADIHGFGLRVPADRKTVTFRLGIADGPWELSGETDGRGNGSSLGVDGKEIVFFGAFEKDENVIIHIAHNITGSDLRVIALGKDGKEYSSGLTQVGGGKINKISAKFAKVTLKDIQAFRLQARPYQWVEFRNISLQPGQKTNVQVVQPDTPKSSDKPE
jgi:hypothetical protein